MHPEYLYNNDTEEMILRVRSLAQSNESALCQYCVEVSCQTDTSSAHLVKLYAQKNHATQAVLADCAQILRALLQFFAENAGVFRVSNAKADFETVCQTITQFAQGRTDLMLCIDELTQVRKMLFCEVAKANEVLHMLSLACDAVLAEQKSHYADMRQKVTAAHGRMTELDRTLREAQNAYMSLIEHHFPTFMQGIREAADLNHAGKEMNRGALRTLCTEMLFLLDRMQNPVF